MAFKRATKAGQVIRIPLLSDPDYLARRLLRPEGIEVVRAEEELFLESLDASVLKTDLTDVTHVMIRGLNGKDFADIEKCAWLEVHAEYNDASFKLAKITEAIKRGLMGIDGVPTPCPVTPLYPIENLCGDNGFGQAWPAIMYELSDRIGKWSSMGEASGSPSAP